MRYSCRQRRHATSNTLFLRKSPLVTPVWVGVGLFLDKQERGSIGPHLHAYLSGSKFKYIFQIFREPCPLPLPPDPIVVILPGAVAFLHFRPMSIPISKSGTLPGRECIFLLKFVAAFERETESESKALLQVNYRQPPTTLYGEKIKEPFYYTSHSNVDRVKVSVSFDFYR